MRLYCDRTIEHLHKIKITYNKQSTVNNINVFCDKISYMSGYVYVRDNINIGSIEPLIRARKS